MLRELLTGLAVVFMASSVIISSIFRQLPIKNVSDDTNTTAGPDVPEPESKPSGDSDSLPR
jgi:hypothetical protein